MKRKYFRDVVLAVASVPAVASAPFAVLAQAITGAVHAQQGGAPVPGAIVILMRGDTNKVAATLTSDDGSFRLQAPAPGTYGLRVDVVGYRSVLVSAFPLDASPAVGRDIRFPFERVPLPAVAVTATSRCDRVAGESGDAARLWGEARKTLEATRIAQDERRFEVTLTRFERELTLPDSSVKSTRSFTQSGVSDNPFVSLTPDSIARVGYRVAAAGKDSYYAPDARLLLSDQFVTGHCFGTRRGGPAGTLGLTFRPQRGSGLVDVDGVLWLDSASAELRSLEYRYTSVPRRESAGGGSVEFGKLPNGVWGVRRWAIRIPVLTVRESRRRPDGALGRFVDTLVTSVQVEGGEVLMGLTAGRPASGTRIRGTVYDSTLRMPLAGAVVTLEGAGRSVRSGGDGGYLLDSLPDEGSFRLRFWHPRLDSLGIEMPRVMVRIRRGEETAALLAVPGAGAIVRERCGVTATEPARIIVGTVRRDGSPASQANVLALQAHPAHDSLGAELGIATVVASESGRFALCQLAPVGRAWLIARTGDAWGQPVVVGDGASATIADITLPPSSATPAAPRPIQELGHLPLPGNESRVEGMVLFTDEPPRAPVQVIVDGRVATTTLSNGLFRLEHVAEGTRQIAFRSAGFAPVNAAPTVRRGESSILLVTLSRAATVATMVPQPEFGSWLQGFESRRRHGQGVFFDRATIERRNVRTFADLLRGVPGIRVLPSGGAYRYVSTYGQRSLSGSSVTDCEMMFYVDGHPYPVEDGAVDEHLRAGDLDAVEVYATASSVPREFAGANSGCGVVVAWRRG
jgi:carboxypeptidase family protein/TonB-dependent receptor-like protein